MSAPAATIRFGVSSLDRLIGPSTPGAGLAIPRDGSSVLTTSLCVIGPDGTGKSVLALHLAAQYIADNLPDGENQPPPVVLYVSTDLTHAMAMKTWNDFDLRHPRHRQEPFDRPRAGGELCLELVSFSPATISTVIVGDRRQPAVCFIDLAQETAGDDWGFVHRTLSLLDMPLRPEDPRHLVLVDAVEGFETLVGDLDAFGEKSTRRSRIAQVMRLAARKAHLLFVVEETASQRLPEEFVTDAVVRLRNIEIHDYVRRTVEVEKTRGQTHVRGQHLFVTRSGRGSTTGTGSDENADDPAVRRYDCRRCVGKVKRDLQSYAHVFGSIHHLSRAEMEDGSRQAFEPTEPEDAGERSDGRPRRYSGFGVPYLDSMLAGDGRRTETGPETDARGLPCGSVTALIGDALTQKSQLGRAFLARTFHAFAKALARGVVEARKQRPAATFGSIVDAAYSELMMVPPPRADDADGKEETVHGVAVLLTNEDVDSSKLLPQFLHWLKPKSLFPSASSDEQELYKQAVTRYILSHTICRRMEIHDVSSPVIAHILQRNIEKAKEKLRAPHPWRIRLVIDDFNALRNTFPDIQRDPLLLPYLLFTLRREGVSTLVLDTQSGRPDVALSERFTSSLREMADYRLYTWRIPFYGETRIGITAIPPLSARSRGLIRELRAVAINEDAERELTVDPHFELYAGLESGNPTAVPLEVRLYPGNAAMRRYIEDANVLFKELFAPRVAGADVVVGFQPSRYDAFREFCYLQRDTRLDHTLVFQVDEFWLTWLTRRSLARRAGVLQRQWTYLDQSTVDPNGRPDHAADAYYLFQKTYREGIKGQQKGPLRRRHFYDEERLGYGLAGNPSDDETAEVDRVPLWWDFGFLLCHSNLWLEFLREAPRDRVYKLVEDCWLRTRQATPTQPPAAAELSWRDFFAACRVISEYHSAKLATPVPIFDLSLESGEDFSCLVLEIWLSEIYDTQRRRDERGRSPASQEPRRRGKRSEPRRHGDQAPRLAHLLSRRRWNRDQVKSGVSLLQGLADDRGKSLDSLLEAQHRGHATGYSLELYKAWLLLIEVLDFGQLLGSPAGSSFEFPTRQSNLQAVAARHWYQSACDLLEGHDSPEDYVAVRLPGRFSARGDWFLAAAGGSRSGRLAHRAMDLLSSRRANMTRLQAGVGLPVRRLVDDRPALAHVRTRLISASGGNRERVSYQDFLKIAGRTRPGRPKREGTDSPNAPVGLEDEFYWLWRSSIYGYARCSRVWQKWLYRVARWWQTIQARDRSTWTSGFELYDGIGQGTEVLARASTLPSWQGWHHLVDILRMELEQVSFGADRDGENPPTG